MKKQWLLIVILVVALAGFVMVGLVRAQGPVANPPLPTGTGPDDVVGPQIPVQGQLTDAGGTPYNGTVDVQFSLYLVETGGTSVCHDTHAVDVANGLFNTTITCGTINITGQQLWLGVQVGADPEMTPRQPIYPVPYALSLRPNAIISGTNDVLPTLWLFNYGDSGALWASGDTGTAIYAQSASTNEAAIEGTGPHIGVQGTASSSTGYGGYFENRNGVGVYGKANSTAGIGVYAKNDLGVALRAESITGTAIFAQGDVEQTLGGNGLVKAALLVDCGDTNSDIHQHFDNVSASGYMSVADGDAPGKCTVTLSFDLNDRFIMASPTYGNPGTTFNRSAHVHGVSGTTFEIFRFDPATGTGANGSVMVIIY